MNIGKGFCFLSVLFLLLFNEALTAQVRILPLGNSITYDQIYNDTRPVGDKISYRYRLYQLLNSAGIAFSYVGTQSSGGNFLPQNYTNNGGFSGITNKQMLAKLRSGYLNNLNPDIILLEIGTNKLSEENVKIFAMELDSILNEIDAFEKRAKKTVHVFLAQIISRAGDTPAANHSPTTNYNKHVAQLKTSRPNDLITLVNMETGAGIDYRLSSAGGDMHDLLHPARSGYTKMAEEWFKHLKPHLTAANLPPVLSAIETTPLAYTAGIKAVSLTSTLVVADAESPNLQSASIKITAGYRKSEDILSFIPANGITSAWNTETGTLTLTGNATVANYQAALRKVNYENTNQTNPDTVVRTASFAVNDGALNSVSVSRNITIRAANAAPVLSSLEVKALNYNEGDGKVLLTSTIVISDANHTNLQSATAKITTGYLKSEDVLAFTPANGINPAWDAETGTLTLTGNATLVNYQAALRKISYENTNKTNPHTAIRKVTFTVSDGNLNSAPVSRDISVTSVNSAPVLSGIEKEALAYTEGDGKVAITASVSISDNDNDSLSTAIVVINSGYVNAEDVLSYTPGNGITASWDKTNGKLTLSGKSSITNYQAALKKVSYENTNIENPKVTARQITIMVAHDTDTSNAVSRSIEIIPVNKAPIIEHLELSEIEYQLAFDSVHVAGAILISDLNDSILHSAIVHLESGYQQGEDHLTITETNQITADWNAETGTLTLNGVATLAEYETALKSIRYHHTNDSVDNSVVKIIKLTLFDGKDHSNTLEQPIKMSLSSPLSAPGLKEKASILLYPNPSSETATLSFSSPLTRMLKMEILSVRGEIIKTQWLSRDTREYKIAVSTLKSGQYFIRFTDNEKMWSILKMQVK